MKKIILVLNFLLLVSCGYQPIFSSKTSNFLIEEIIYNENDKISLKIRNNLTYLSNAENYIRVIRLKLSSEKFLIDNITGSHLSADKLKLSPYQVLWVSLSE